jgi:hypothetical protein
MHYIFFSIFRIQMSKRKGYYCLMSSLQIGPVIHRANLQRAHEAIVTGMSVYRAARQYNVPESTLRDRTRGNVDIEAKVGQDTIFTKDEEKDFVNHMTYMARIGFGYSKAKIQLVGRDYAQALGKNLRFGELLQLSNNWLYGMLKRWPELKLVKRKSYLCRGPKLHLRKL